MTAADLTALKERAVELIREGNHEDAKAELARLENGEIDEEGNTLYHEAVLQQDVNLLRWLLTHYQSTVSPNKPDKSGTTCFHLACHQGKTTCFMALWDSSKAQRRLFCETTDSSGHTALHIACLEGHLDVAREIVSKVKNTVFTTNERKQSALHVAAAGGHTPCVRLLAQFRKLVDALDLYNATALHYSVRGGHVATAKYLIERCHAKTNLVTTNQMNLSHAAVVSGNFAMVKYILNKTKERTHFMVTSTGASVLHIAAGMGYEKLLEFLLAQPYIHQYINNQEKNGWTAAHLAALRNKAGCLAILIGFGADIHTSRDKNKMSVYQTMCYNESSDMRRTFPQLFEQLDFVRGNRRAHARHKSPRKSHSLFDVGNENKTVSQNGYALKEKQGSKRTSSFSASHIMKTQMDFTKTNPIAEDSTPGLQQRRFQKNNMALPRTGPSDGMATSSYQMGSDRSDGSDDDIDVEDIELIPETPLRKVQQFNYFRRSVYTPPQTTEGVTKINSIKHVDQPQKLPNQDSGLALPVIVDYSERGRGDAVTIYFHNGHLHTVKVKTTTDSIRPAEAMRSLTSSELDIHREPEISSPQEIIINDGTSSVKSQNVHSLEQEEKDLAESSDESLPPPPSTAHLEEFFKKTTEEAVLTVDESDDPNQPETSAASREHIGIPPPDYSKDDSQSTDSVTVPKRSSVIGVSEDITKDTAGITEPDTEGQNSRNTSDLKSSRSHQAILAAAKAFPVPLPYTSRQSNSYTPARSNVIHKLDERNLNASFSHQEVLVEANALPTPLLHTSQQHNGHSVAEQSVMQEVEQRNMEAVSNQGSLDDSNAFPDPLRYTSQQQNIYSSAKENVVKELEKRNRSMLGNSIQANSETESNQELENFNKTIEAAANIPGFIDDGPSSMQRSAAEANGVENINSNEHGIAQPGSFSASLSTDVQRSPAISHHNSADDIEREYLLFVEDELNKPDNRSASSKASSASSEPVFGETKQDRSMKSADANSRVQRLPSAVSDASIPNIELKSSTSFKFNYRAYNKKISTKPDTATDLFEYGAIG